MAYFPGEVRQAAAMAHAAHLAPVCWSHGPCASGELIRRRSREAKNHQVMDVRADVGKGANFVDDEKDFSFLWQLVPRACIEHVVVELVPYAECLKRAASFDLRNRVIAHGSNPDLQSVDDGL